MRSHVCLCVLRRAYVCQSVRPGLCVCAPARACMSMSSPLTNPSHPSDTTTLSTLCFLSPSDSLPPRRGARTLQMMHPPPSFFSLRNGLIYTRQFSATATALSPAIFPCICRQIQTSVCKDAQKTSSECICIPISM